MDFYGFVSLGGFIQYCYGSRNLGTKLQKFTCQIVIYLVQELCVTQQVQPNEKPPLLSHS